MPEIFTDYVNKTVLTLPDKFIDVKTGASHIVSKKIQEQVEYHATNNTLIHLLLSALNNYLHPKLNNGSNEEILFELLEIKNMMQQGYAPKNNFQISYPAKHQHKAPIDLEMKDVEDVLDAFGG
jgi:hypothetical protein